VGYLRLVTWQDVVPGGELSGGSYPGRPPPAPPVPPSLSPRAFRPGWYGAETPLAGPAAEEGPSPETAPLLATAHAGTTGQVMRETCMWEATPTLPLYTRPYRRFTRWASPRLSGVEASPGHEAASVDSSKAAQQAEAQGR
jgi:hypothetical protein